MCETAADRWKALQILRDNDQGKGKPSTISLCTELTSLQKSGCESVTECVICAETAIAVLRKAGEILSDALLVAAVLKGLQEFFQSICDPFRTARNEVEEF